MPEETYRKRSFILSLSCVAVLAALIVWLPVSSAAQDPASFVTGMQKRYASVATLAGSFRQTYRAPGIVQEESGEFWMKRPGLMRWEYRVPETKIFVADGRESFLYIPEDRQVTIQPFSESDLHNTPLEFLLGSGDVNRAFTVGDEKEFKPKLEGTVMIRLTPRSGGEYAFIALELDRATYEIKRISIKEQSGNVSEFLFTNLVANRELDKKLFRFKPPKGVEVIRLDED